MNISLFHCGIDHIFIYQIFFFLKLIVFQLKSKLQILTLAIGGVGLVSAYVSYSPDIAVRYLDSLHAY